MLLESVVGKILLVSRVEIGNWLLANGFKLESVKMKVLWLLDFELIFPEKKFSFQTTQLLAEFTCSHPNFRFEPSEKAPSHETILQPDLCSTKSTTLNPMVKSDLVTYGDVMTLFLFLQATNRIDTAYDEYQKLIRQMLLRQNLVSIRKLLVCVCQLIWHQVVCRMAPIHIILFS